MNIAALSLLVVLAILGLLVLEEHKAFGTAKVRVRVRDE